VYKTILVTLEISATDRVIIDHIKKLAKVLASRVVLLHVATGVPAIVHGPDAAGEEISSDQEVLNRTRDEFSAAGIEASAVLAYGDPVKEIVKWVGKNSCDLVAMATHGHKLVADILLGEVANKVQHAISVPVLLLRAR